MKNFIISFYVLIYIAILSTYFFDDNLTEYISSTIMLVLISLPLIITYFKNKKG